MTVNASITKTEDGQFAVQAFREMRCPACERLLFESNGADGLRVSCSRCKARWHIVGNEFHLISPPKKLTGKLLENWLKFRK